MVLAGEKVFLLTNSDNYTMPNMKGWSRTDVFAYSKLINKDIIINGEGYVTLQNIKANKVIGPDDIIEVNLEDKY